MEVPREAHEIGAPETLGKSIWMGWIRKFRDGLVSAFKEDPAVAAILTPDFLNTFENEFHRMLRERREGVTEGEQRPSFGELLHVNGWEMQYTIFDILIRDYPSIDALSPRSRMYVIERLMKQCGLPGSGML